jgi:hypothetical protein
MNEVKTQQEFTDYFWALQFHYKLKRAKSLRMDSRAIKVVRRSTMRRDLKERMRQRVRHRLDELGMSGRELAAAVRPRPHQEDPEDWEHKLDSWMSSILTGRAALTWEYVDAVCEHLRIGVSELVRDDQTELRELTPSEMRLLRYYQEWPRAVQDRWLKLLEFFAGSILEPDKVRLLDAWEEMSSAEQRELHAYLHALRTVRTQRTAAPAGGPHAIESAEPALPDTTRPSQREKSGSAIREPNDDPEQT